PRGHGRRQRWNCVRALSLKARRLKVTVAVAQRESHRVAEIVSFAASAPRTVPNAAHSATNARSRNQKPNRAISGGPTNSDAAKIVENAKDHINRGLGLLARVAPIRVVNAINALKGKTRMIEKSTARA